MIGYVALIFKKVSYNYAPSYNRFLHLLNKKSQQDFYLVRFSDYAMSI